MVEAFNIIQDRIARSRLAGDPPDATIGPKVGTLGLFDFHRAGEAIDIGYESARRVIPEIVEAISAQA
jgi:NTE family protein